MTKEFEGTKSKILEATQQGIETIKIKSKAAESKLSEIIREYKKANLRDVNFQEHEQDFLI